MSCKGRKEQSDGPPYGFVKCKIVDQLPAAMKGAHGYGSRLECDGGPLRDQGDFNAAADFYRRAVSIRAKVAPDSLPAAERLAGLSQLERRQGNRTLALEYDRRPLALGEKSCANSW
jgi:hypothetical protein